MKTERKLSTTDELLSRLRIYPIFQQAKLKVENRNNKKVLSIESPEIELFAQGVLGIAALSDHYGVEEVLLSAGDDHEPMVFPVSALEIWGMKASQQKDERLEEVLEGLNHAEAVIVSGSLIDLAREQLRSLELDDTCACDYKADDHYRRAMLLLQHLGSSLTMAGEELLTLLHRFKSELEADLEQSKNRIS